MRVKQLRGMFIAAAVGLGMWACVWLAVSCSAEADTRGPVSVRVELDCPTEDSCAIDYHDGAWYVTAVKP